jgi:hypothetical protein
MPRRSGFGSPSIHLHPRMSAPVSALPVWAALAEPSLDGKSKSGKLNCPLSFWQILLYGLAGGSSLPLAQG